MKFSVCMDAVYSGKDFLKGVDEVGRLGYKAIELWMPETKDLAGLRELLDKWDMEVSLVLYERISMVDPNMHQANIDKLKEMMDMCGPIGAKRFIALAGLSTHTDDPHDVQIANTVECIKKLDTVLEDGMELVLEPLSGRNDPLHEKYILQSSDEGFRMLDAIGSKKVRLLFDIFHQQRTEGDITVRMLENLDRIGYIHCAGNPGRHEIDNGEINYQYIFGELKKAGYDGFVGLEYWPEEEPENGLARILDWV